MRLKSGDIITMKQGSMEVYVVMPSRLKHLGNLHNGSNATRYAGAKRLRWPCAVMIDGVPFKIDVSKITQRPVIVSR